MTGRLRRSLTVVVAGLIGLFACALSRAREAARGVPLSSVTADWYVGPDFVTRHGLATGETVPGELDDVARLDGESFDPDRLHDDVRRFYERTAAYDLRYRARWHRPFRVGAALASRLTSHVEQLNLPPPGDEGWHRMESAFLAVAEPGAVDGPEEADEPTREDVRGWVRTDPETGEAVFVALYATHHRDGEGFVNITAPIPGGGVDTVLRPANLGRGDGTGVRFTTEGAGDPGLYLRTPLGAFAVPGGQRFEVWHEGNSEGLRATHEMWLLGRPLLTVEYGMTPEGEAQTSTSTS